MTIRNPVEWSADNFKLTAANLKSAFRRPDVDLSLADPQIRHITMSDLKDVLNEGWNDFTAYRTDVIFLCLIYPLAGLAIARFTLGNNLLPLLFPFVSGFALVGPFAAAGLYEMSRRREQGLPVSWVDAFGVFQSPSIGAILKLGLLMTGVFLLWLAAAMAIYNLTLGPAMPVSISSFATDVVATKGGWALTFFGVGIGFLFAVAALALSVVSFPLLLDRRVSNWIAVRTSVRAVLANPVPMLAWGLIVAGSLVLAAIPALLGLVVIMPLLGHATWHLYRKVVS